MSDPASKKSASPAVLSLAQLLEQQPSTAPACLVEPGLLPPQGILFVGGEPKAGKSLLVANLALALAAGGAHALMKRWEGLLDRTALTVTGRTVEENLAAAAVHEGFWT